MPTRTGEPQQMSPVKEEAEHFGRSTHMFHTTEFECLTSVEPMEGEGGCYMAENHTDLDLKFEDHGNVALKHGDVRMTSCLKKRTSFAEHPEIVKYPKEETNTTAETIPCEARDQYEMLDRMDDQDVDLGLADKFDNISVSTHSEYSEECPDQQVPPDEAKARLEQVSARIFATFLPENESAEERHCDLVRAQTQLAEITSSSEVLVINCGESNVQLLTTFKRVQNCPFNLDGKPDLATFVAVCERIHDWLMVSDTYVVLLHAEGTVARARLLLLLRALSAYYEGSERFNPSVRQALRLYLISYPNGHVQLPVSWLRYTGYMRLFSPENCLGILRATVGIYHISLHSYPVFEDNKLRLFFKFYSGSPLRLIYTTNIHDFPGAQCQNLRLTLLSTLDGKTVNTGLRLQGDITLLAYHARPYPKERIRLFRLHFHSCQAVSDILTFQRADLDDLCEAFPLAMHLKLHCSNFPIQVADHAVVSEETVELASLGQQKFHSSRPPISSLTTADTGMLSPDDAVRRHDSLENLSGQSTRQHTRKLGLYAFDSMESWARSRLVGDCQSQPSRRQDDPPPDSSQTVEHKRHHTRRLKSIFSSFREVKEKPELDTMISCDNQAVTSTSPYTEALMPPPSVAYVKKRALKRKPAVGRRLFELLSGRPKPEAQSDASDVESQDSIAAELVGIPSSECSHSISSSSSTCENSSVGSVKGWFTSLRHSGEKSKTKTKREPPRKLRKTEHGSQITSSSTNHPFSEDLLEAARRLNFMAGTQELDRLLEELRLTSMQMSAGLPPTNPSYSPKTYSSSANYAHRTHNAYSSNNNNTTTQTRYHTTRSSSTIGLYGTGGLLLDRSSRAGSTGPTGYNNYHQRLASTSSSSYQTTERRLDGLSRPTHYPTTYRSNVSPLSNPRHHTTYTTVLKHRPPTVPKQLSQVHLTIDPDCGMTEPISHGSTTMLTDREAIMREQRLESELNSAKREIAQLRRAMSLVEERQRSEFSDEFRSTLTTQSNVAGLRSPSSVQHNLLSPTSATYQTHQNVSRLGSTFQRTSPRNNDGLNTGAFPLTKRTMSHTNVQGPRSWNLRTRQGSESELAYKRITSTSNPSGRSGYSAHRERLKQEREQELLMQKHRQLTGSSIGFNDQQYLHQQARQQQQYRSLSAVNTGGMSDTVEEIETIILQPIGRGVQDIDSRAGSMTTLARQGGGSLMDGLNRMDGQRSGLAGRGYQSTQFLNRTTPTSELIRPIPVHQSQTNIAPNVGVHPRYGTPTALGQSVQSVQVNGSRSQLSTNSSTIVGPTPSTQPMTNGWKPETPKSNAYQEATPEPSGSSLGMVQDTAPIWYRPNLSREAAIRSLRLQAPGSFLIRDSTTFKGAFGLAVKVATLPPKVTPKSDDLQSELVRHYLIEVVNVPTKGVRLKGFASEPVFPSLAALIYQHTYEPLALPCRLILPPVPTMLPSSGSAALPPLVIGTTNGPTEQQQQQAAMGEGFDAVTVTPSSATMLGANAPGPLEFGSTQQIDEGLTRTSRTTNDHTMVPMDVRDENVVASQNVPFICVLRESPSHQGRAPIETGMGQGITFRCLMLGSIDTPQWDNQICFARSVDQLIPLTVLTAAECDNGISRVRYTEVQLHVSAHDGITIIDLQRRLFLRRHLPNHILVYCGLEPRKKEFQHPEHEAHGITHPQIFGVVVRKGISEYTTYVFSECDPSHTASSIVQHIRSTYPHLEVR